MSKLKKVSAFIVNAAVTLHRKAILREHYRIEVRAADAGKAVTNQQKVVDYETATLQNARQSAARVGAELRESAAVTKRELNALPGKYTA